MKDVKLILAGVLICTSIQYTPVAYSSAPSKLDEVIWSMYGGDGTQTFPVWGEPNDYLTLPSGSKLTDILIFFDSYEKTEGFGEPTSITINFLKSNTDPSGGAGIEFLHPIPNMAPTYMGGDVFGYLQKYVDGGPDNYPNRSVWGHVSYPYPNTPPDATANFRLVAMGVPAQMPEPIPEPSVLYLMLCGLGTLGFVFLKRKPS